VGRIPYHATEPKHLIIASEVTTIGYLHSHGIPVPRIYSYSANSENAAGTEYLFMELVGGTNLGDLWFELPEKARIHVVTKIVELESRLFSLTFPTSGSLYYIKDLPAEINKVNFPTTESEEGARFCIGPDTRLSLWDGKGADIATDRGPCKRRPSIIACITFRVLEYLTDVPKMQIQWPRLKLVPEKRWHI
jgi:hypothetical protein